MTCDFIPDLIKPIQARNAYSRSMAVSLADIIAGLLNEHEPLLQATHDGNEVIVTEKGGSGVFTVAVDPGMLGTRVMRERNQPRGAVRANNAPVENK